MATARPALAYCPFGAKKIIDFIPTFSPNSKNKLLMKRAPRVSYKEFKSVWLSVVNRFEVVRVCGSRAPCYIYTTNRTKLKEILLFDF